MKNSLIQVSGHISPGFIENTFYTVADFRNMIADERIEFCASISDGTIPYYADKGWKNIVISETGEKFARKYKITGIVSNPTIVKFQWESQARAYAKKLEASK